MKQKQTNNHMKEIKSVTPLQPKSSFNPLKWNWYVIIAWGIIGFIGYFIFKNVFNFIF